MLSPTLPLKARLRVARKDIAGLSTTAMAEQLGVTHPVISYYESGRSKPSIDVVVRWAEITGVDVVWLAFGPQVSDRYTRVPVDPDANMDRDGDTEDPDQLVLALAFAR